MCASPWHQFTYYRLLFNSIVQLNLDSSFFRLSVFINYQCRARITCGLRVELYNHTLFVNAVTLNKKSFLGFLHVLRDNIGKKKSLDSSSDKYGYRQHSWKEKLPFSIVFVMGLWRMVKPSWPPSEHVDKWSYAGFLPFLFQVHTVKKFDYLLKLFGNLYFVEVKIY